MTLKDGSGQAQILDLGIERQKDRTWAVTELYVARSRRGPFRTRLGETLHVGIEEVTGLTVGGADQAADSLLATLGDMKPADMADALHDLSDSRMLSVASQLPDSRLADVLEELEEDDQVKIVSSLDPARAADVLDVMQPDDCLLYTSPSPRDS